MSVSGIGSPRPPCQNSRDSYLAMGTVDASCHDLFSFCTLRDVFSFGTPLVSIIMDFG